MPHISVTLIEGKSDDQKRALAQAIARETCRTLGVDEKYVSIELTELAREDWQTRFYPEHIAPKLPELLKKPSY
ncbi:tautomerase family protein [Salipiger sp. P9]|uniref:tautomerase family protein n=1 Tax=Salipiger pentaromativorans TaxID=2943193 RepID=UPI0021589D65|nr:tautomerase family protein [Salipiger pentaromativorans]MCR8547564.1 tautomerase family protein [Salipiger pentaromativorans]